MPAVLASIAIRLLCCLAVSYGLWRFVGPVGLVVSAPLYGVLLAKPLFELFAETRAAAKTLAFSQIQGRNFEHRGFKLDIVEDDLHHRWINLKDVQKLIPTLPRPGVLQAQFPDDVQEDSKIHGQRINANALLLYLAKSTEPSSLRFRNWLEREVVLPGAKVRERLGIREQQSTTSDNQPTVP